MVSFLHVTDARYLGGYRIWLRFNNGDEGEVDLTGELWGPMFEPLQDVALFKQLFVNPDLDTVSWPNGAGLAPEFFHARLKRAA